MMKHLYFVILIFLCLATPTVAEENRCAHINSDAAAANELQKNSCHDGLDLSKISLDNGANIGDSLVNNSNDTALSQAVKADSKEQGLKDLSYQPLRDGNHPQPVSKSSEFLYYIDRPKNASGDVVILLHGSGGNEKSLIPFARSIWPRATLVGIRGRIMQKGQRRWYKKITATKFDQKDIQQEAAAFVRFLTGLADENDLDMSRSTFIGYSNGANLLAVVLLQQPNLVRRAVLMRSMPVLDKMPHANLDKTSILTLSGQKDKLYSPFAPALSSLLKNNGAKVESHMVAADHMIGDFDKQFIASWIGAGNSDSLSAMSLPKENANNSKINNGR